MPLQPGGSSGRLLTFEDDERDAAVEAARDLDRAARLHDIDLDNLDLVAPCDGCRRPEYRVSVGHLSGRDAAGLIQALSAAVPSGIPRADSAALALHRALSAIGLPLECAAVVTRHHDGSDSLLVAVEALEVREAAVLTEALLNAARGAA
ncbi:hypothetical protein [Streptomyces sp. SM12]|uniref:hypothetical protein n=1 Tax=Streptomyces sp. SM12 TaxID=1071602 RepID=UPI000CD5AD2D|nr:hypothetical protein [Streptomyces sp. SM12]